MRRVFENVVFLVSFAVDDFLDLRFDADKSITELVDFVFVFTFSGLNHQASNKWPTHRRRVEAVVHETLGNVLLSDSNLLFVLTKIDDQLVSHSPLGTRESDLEMRSESLSHVVCVEN